MSKGENLNNAYGEVSKSQYGFSKSESLLNEAKEKYRLAALDVAIENIINIQSESGKIDDFSLRIILQDLIHKTVTI